MKKFFFCLGHWLGFIFVAFWLWIKLLLSKRKYFNSQTEQSNNTLENCYDYLYGLIRMANFCAFSKVKIKGAKNIPFNKPVFFAPNHKSNFDVVVFLYAIQKLKQDSFPILDPTFLAKIELQESKKITYVAKMINAIFIDRKNLRELINVNKQEVELLQKNTQSLVVFLEGTRIKDENIIGDFKPAGLTPAYTTFCPIVPVMIYGTLGVEGNNKKQIFKYKEITVEFLEPFKYKDFINSSKDLIAEKIKSKIESAYLTVKADPLWKENKEED